MQAGLLTLTLPLLYLDMQIELFLFKVYFKFMYGSI